MPRRHVMIPIVASGAPSIGALLGGVLDVGSVSLSWSPANPAAGSTISFYRVYDNNVLKQNNITTLSASYTGLTNGVIHNFYITAVSNQGVESGPSNTVSCDWPYFDTSIPVQNVTPGGTFSVLAYTHDPNPAKSLNYGRTGSVNDTAPIALAVDPITGLGVVPVGTLAGTYTIEGYVSDTPNSNSLMADWLIRSTDSGVMWAHIFTSPTDPSLWWGASPQDVISKKRAGYIGPNPPLSADVSVAGRGYVTTDGVVRTEGGIMGDGCLEIYVPAYQSTGGLSYRRPLAPTTGPMQVIGTGSSAMTWTPNSFAAADLDINLANLPRYDLKLHESGSVGDVRAKLGGMVGGMITNAADFVAYQRTVPATLHNSAGPEITHAGPDGIYLQFRQKFKTLLGNKNRLDYAESKIYRTDTLLAATAVGTVTKTGTVFPSGTVAGVTTTVNVGIKNECYAPVVIGGVTFSQYITLINCGAYSGTWRVLTIDVASANKITIELNSVGFPAVPSGGTWSATYQLFELTVGAGHDYWTPIASAGNNYRQRLDVIGGNFVGTYLSNGITATGVIARIPWSTTMPALTGPSTVSGYFGPSEGKLWNIYTQPSNSGGLSNQIVCTVRPDNGNAFFLFGNAGQNWNYGEKLGGNQVQYPGNPTCNFADMASGNCWSYSKDEWITIMLHIIPGQQNFPRQLTVDTSPDSSLPIASITRNGKRTVLHLPGLSQPGPMAKFVYAGKGYQIIGPSNWANPTNTLTILNETGASTPIYNIDYTAETIDFAWNTDNMPAYDGNAILHVATMQTWDTWRNTPVATHFNQGIEVYVAKQSDIDAARAAGQVPQYTKINSVLNYQMYFDTDYGVRSLVTSYPPEISYTPTAPGYNYIEFYPYMNPETGAAVPYAFPLWLLYDQFVCSTKFVPCPTI